MADAAVIGVERKVPSSYADKVTLLELLVALYALSCGRSVGTLAADCSMGWKGLVVRGAAVCPALGKGSRDGKPCVANGLTSVVGMLYSEGRNETALRRCGTEIDGARL